MSDITIRFLSHNRKAVCEPNPAYPDGIDVDLTYGGIEPACHFSLPYPAECCGVWHVECKTCGVTAGITAAGRVDDPKSVKINCRREKA